MDTYHDRVIQSSRLQLRGKILVEILRFGPDSIVCVHVDRTNVSVEIVARIDRLIEEPMHMVGSEISSS